MLLRHAKSDWSGDEADIDRPLAKRGRRQAPEAGRWLNDSVAHVDLAVVSPAVRARSTWDLVSAELATPPPVQVEDRAYASSGSELLDVVRALPDEAVTVVLVGHNPAVAELASHLAGRSVPMPTSAIAVIAVSGRWATAGPDRTTLEASGRPPASDTDR